VLGNIPINQRLLKTQIVQTPVSEFNKVSH